MEMNTKKDGKDKIDKLSQEKSAYSSPTKKRRKIRMHSQPWQDMLNEKNEKIKNLENKLRENQRKEKEKWKVPFTDLQKNFLEPQLEDLAIRYVRLQKALPFEKILFQWIPALQDLIGLAHALDTTEEINPELGQIWAEDYLQKMQRIKLDVREEDPILMKEAFLKQWENLKEADQTADLVRWWMEIEQETHKNPDAILKQKLVESLYPKLQEVQRLEPADCLTPEGKEILFDTADLAEDGLRSVGYFPEFYNSRRTQRQIKLQPALDTSYNEGSSSSIEIPVVFLRRECGWELLNGCVGETCLKRKDKKQPELFGGLADEVSNRDEK